jgi:Glycosyl hydrolases family 16
MRRKPQNSPRLWRAYQPTRDARLAEGLGLATPASPENCPLSRLFAAVCLSTISLLATPQAVSRFAVDTAFARAVAASGAAAALESRVELLDKPPARTPRPIRGDGYSVVFKDTFRKLRRRVWDNREWWNVRPPRRSQYVRNGKLNLVSRRSQGYENITMTTFSSHKVFKFGYFEARIKWTKGIGSWPAFWLMSNAWARRGANDCSLGIRAAEIDIFEGYGQYPRVFNGAIHRNSGDFICSPPTDEFNPNSFQPQGFDLTRRFHTYAARWTPTRVTWFLDQRRMMSWPTYGTTDTRMFILLSTQVTDDPPTDSSSPNQLRTKFDWVRVWQKR